MWRQSKSVFPIRTVTLFRKTACNSLRRVYGLCNEENIRAADRMGFMVTPELGWPHFSCAGGRLQAAAQDVVRPAR